MQEFNRRRFLKLVGQSTAVLGIGLPFNSLAQAGNAKAKTTTEVGKYQVFQPGDYFDWEKGIIEERIARASGSFRPESKGLNNEISNPLMAGMSRRDNSVGKAELLGYNRTWDPYNPLFNNEEYAREAGYPDIPAWPCFKTPMAEGLMGLTIPKNIADTWYYANDGSDVRFYVPIFAGDSFTSKVEKLTFKELTLPGSNLRHFEVGSVANLYNKKGELIVKSSGTLRNAYRKIIDGSPKPTFTENMSEWCEYFPPAHYTTDEEWEYIRELWKKESIRGKDTLYWEDVKIGDEPIWTCSGPISHMDLVFWYGGGGSGLTMRNSRESPDVMFRDRYGIYLDERAMHYGGRNIPGSRMVFYNNTASNHITRMITNYIGDQGFVTRICWYFKQLFREMQVERPGGEHLDKVPYMKGKQCTVHGSEGDTVIAKGYVTDKYIDKKGHHIIDMTCWGETLDNRIIQIVAASARLPSKKG